MYIEITLRQTDFIVGRGDLITQAMPDDERERASYCNFQ